MFASPPLPTECSAVSRQVPWRWRSAGGRELGVATSFAVGAQPREHWSAVDSRCAGHSSLVTGLCCSTDACGLQQ